METNAVWSVKTSALGQDVPWEPVVQDVDETTARAEFDRINNDAMDGKRGGFTMVLMQGDSIICLATWNRSAYRKIDA